MHDAFWEFSVNKAVGGREAEKHLFSHWVKRWVCGKFSLKLHLQFTICVYQIKAAVTNATNLVKKMCRGRHFEFHFMLYLVVHRSFDPVCLFCSFKGNRRCSLRHLALRRAILCLLFLIVLPPADKYAGSFRLTMYPPIFPICFEQTFPNKGENKGEGNSYPLC